MRVGLNKAVWVFIIVYVGYFFWLCFLKFNSFAYNDFDLAIHNQISWNILHGSIFNSILGVDFLANHAYLFAFLLSPIYAIFPHPLTLLFFQTLALGLSVLPIYLLARENLSYRWALAVSFIYLSYAPLAYTNLYEFHPTVFAAFSLSFMMYYFYRNRFLLFLLFGVLAMSCQENIPLVVIMTTFLALLKRKKPKWIIVPLVVGGVYFWVLIAKLMPYFNKDTLQFIGIYRHLGDSYSKIVKNILLDPWQVGGIIFMKPKMVYLAQLFAPLLFIPFLSPSSLLPSLPLFLQHLLSLRPSETNIAYHYTAEMIPFIFLSFIYGIKKLINNLEWLKKRQGAMIAFLLLVSTGYSLYLGPHLMLFKEFGNILFKDQADIQKEIILKQIPKDASVAATFEFLSRLSSRRELYSFHHVYMGFYTLSRKPYRLPDDVSYALLDFNDNLTFRGFYGADRYQNLRKFLNTDNWGVVDVRDTIVLLHKGAPGKYSLYSVLSTEPQPKTQTAAVIDNDIKLLGFELGEEGSSFLHITLYWQSLHKTEKDINVFFDFIDSAGKLVSRLLSPVCYRIFPTNAWQPGEFIKEEKYLVIPGNLRGSGYLLKMGFFDYATMQLIPGNADDKLGRIDLYS